MDIFSIFFNMKAYCVFSLASPHRGDSNEYTQYTIFNIKRKSPKLSQICSYGFCSKGIKNEFKTALVNEPSVFEPLKFYCFCPFRELNRCLLNTGCLLNRGGHTKTGFTIVDYVYTRRLNKSSTKNCLKDKTSLLRSLVPST